MSTEIEHKQSDLGYSKHKHHKEKHTLSVSKDEDKHKHIHSELDKSLSESSKHKHRNKDKDEKIGSEFHRSHSDPHVHKKGDDHHSHRAHHSKSHQNSEEEDGTGHRLHHSHKIDSHHHLHASHKPHHSKSYHNSESEEGGHKLHHSKLTRTEHTEKDDGDTHKTPLTEFTNKHYHISISHPADQKDDGHHSGHKSHHHSSKSHSHHNSESEHHKIDSHHDKDGEGHKSHHIPKSHSHHNSESEHHKIDSHHDKDVDHHHHKSHHHHHSKSHSHQNSESEPHTIDSSDLHKEINKLSESHHHDRHKKDLNNSFKVHLTPPTKSRSKGEIGTPTVGGSHSVTPEGGNSPKTIPRENPWAAENSPVPSHLNKENSTTLTTTIAKNPTISTSAEQVTRTNSDNAQILKIEAEKPSHTNEEALQIATSVHKGFSKKKIGLNDFERLKLIGVGGVGHVYLVRLKDTEQLYAMKVCRKVDMEKQNKIKRALTEREVLATADHPFISTLYYSFQSATQLCFIMQYCAGGEFYRVIQRQPMKCLTEDQVKFYSAEVLLALEYLHLKGFIYRDLKPENILMHATGHVLLTDFDLSKHAVNPVQPRIVTKMFSGNTGVVSEPDIITNSFVGTEEYLAPEVIKGTGHNATVDWWTFGILIYEILYGITPFKGKNQQETFQKIQKQTALTFPSHPRGTPVTKTVKSLLKALLVADSKKRLGTTGGATDIKDHPFFKDIKWSLLRQMTPPIVPKLSDPLDTRYFKELQDNWEWDEKEIDPATLANDDKWKGFQHVDHGDRPADGDFGPSKYTNTPNTNNTKK